MACQNHPLKNNPQNHLFFPLLESRNHSHSEPCLIQPVFGKKQLGARLPTHPCAFKLQGGFWIYTVFYSGSTLAMPNLEDEERDDS